VIRPTPLWSAQLAVGAVALAGCGGASDSKSPGGASPGSGGNGKALSLVAYSTPQVVYDQVIPAFQKTPAGKGVGFKTSYGASGEQSRAVEAGLPADVVTFSLAPDVNRLVKAGLVDANWSKEPHDGFVSTSVVSLIVRKGNPKHIKGWADLLKPGIKVLTPNPFTSGAAKWNLVAAYGANSAHGKNPQSGLDYVRQLITKHVTVQDKSGREALQNFTSGTGDVLISYENEALTAQKKGKDVDYVIPDDTIKIENPIAVTTKAPAAAKAFAAYAESKPAQEQFASWGYRPVDPSVLAANANKFPTPPNLFTIRDVGGWSAINLKLFDPKSGAIAKIENDAGVSTSK
jgi:sulfate transport system substrate-binding protein